MPFPREWKKIQNFVESNEQIEQRIKMLAGGLAKVVSDSDYEKTVQIVHQSVNDFLCTKKLALLFTSINTSTISSNLTNILFQCQTNLYRSYLIYFVAVSSNRKISNWESEYRFD